MDFKKAQKLSKKISVNDAQTVLAYFDFMTNLDNFSIQEEFIETLWDFTERIIETNFSELSEAYNFDTISYALMAFLSENEMEDLINSLFPTPEAKLTRTVDYDFVREITTQYNDLETTYEI